MADINKKIVRCCKNGEQEAFRMLYSRYEGYLYRLCFSYLRSKEDTMDVMQEIFIKIYKNIDTFDENRELLPWLKKIAINTCLNQLRAQDKRKYLSLDYEENGYSFSEYFASDDNVEGKVVRSTIREAVRECLEFLPPYPRLILTLRYLEDLSYQEIAQYLNQPLGTVKNSLFRARSHLKIILVKKGLLEV